jgi:hypothetical protein
MFPLHRISLFSSSFLYSVVFLPSFFFFHVIPCRPLLPHARTPLSSSSSSDDHDDDVDLEACACHHHDRRPPPPICDSAVLLFGRLFRFLTYLSLLDQLLFVALFCSRAFFFSFILQFRRVVFVGF